MTNRKRLLAGLVLAANALLIVATLGVGYLMTSRYDSMIFAYQEDQVQKIADVAIDDMVWRSQYDVATNLAAQVTRDKALVGAIKDKDEQALAAAVEDNYHRGAVTSGEVPLLGLSVLNAAGETLIDDWRDAKQDQALPAKLVEAIAARKGAERLRFLQYAWLRDNHPVMSVVAPVGGLKLLGYAILHLDVVPSLSAIDQRLGVAAQIRSIDGTVLAEPKNVEIAEGAAIRSLALKLKTPQGETMALLDATLDASNLTNDLDDARQTAFLTFIGVALVVLATALGAVWVFMGRIEAQEAEAHQELEESRKGQAEAERRNAENQRRAQDERKQEMHNLADRMEQRVKAVAKAISQSASQLQNTADTLSTNADVTTSQTAAVSSATEQATANVQTVSAAGTELSSSIREIARQVTDSARIAREAVEQADATNQRVESLSQASQRIGEVVGLIHAIAAQTNLLALNATIESARAGEAGKGFAVVAGEVKNLAGQTGRATDEIVQQIQSIQQETTDALAAIRVIGTTIERINELSMAVSDAVDQQDSAASEIARNVEQAAAGTAEVSRSIADVAQAARDTGGLAQDVAKAAAELLGESDVLQREVDAFLSEIRA